MITAFIVSAGLYAALLFVFAALPIWIIPGVTAVRLGNAIPPFTSLLFGPAAAWGSAVGNLIGFDILGGALTIGSIGASSATFSQDSFRTRSGTGSSRRNPTAGLSRVC
jgi:energy-coupling factor transport system substrate-specific component